MVKKNEKLSLSDSVHGGCFQFPTVVLSCLLSGQGCYQTVLAALQSPSSFIVICPVTASLQSVGIVHLKDLLDLCVCWHFACSKSAHMIKSRIMSMEKQ